MAKSQIYEWISFALAKRSETLELDFAPVPSYSDFSDQFYHCIRSSPNGIFWIKPLKTLKLSNAVVTGELLEFILSNCPELAILEVVESKGLVNLRIDHGASLQLQHLGILFCENLKTIEIMTAPNLVSFAYRGWTIGLHVDNAPSLVRVYLGSMGRDNLNFAFVSLGKYLSQLEWLRLDIACINFGFNLQFPHGELTKLKHLTLRVFVHSGENLMGITRLINTSPSLEKFTLQLKACKTTRLSRCSTSKRKHANCSHSNLKEIEIVGFLGNGADLELAQYLLQNAVMLRKFVIKVCSPVSIGTPHEFEYSKVINIARMRAKKFESSIRRKIDFQII